jgi:glycerophosphoryl diester phosphodiesterase
MFLKGAAYVEFDVHLSKDCVPIVYHDLTCCISTKKVNNNINVVGCTLYSMLTFYFMFLSSC